MSSTASKGGRYTVVFARGLYELAVAWAKAEDRALGSVLTYALETGLRTLLRRGEIPAAAIRRYHEFCEEHHEA